LARSDLPLTDLLDAIGRHNWERSIEAPTLGPWKRASAIGHCPRSVIFEMRGVPYTRQWDDRTIRNLAWGKRLHTAVKGDLDEIGILTRPAAPQGRCPACQPGAGSADEWHVEDEQLHVRGHLDAIAGGDVGLAPKDRPDLVRLFHSLAAEYGADLPRTVVEIKSAHSGAMKYALKEGPPEHYMMQLGEYKLLVDASPSLPFPTPTNYLLLMVGKDSWGYLCFPLADKWVAKAEQRTGELNRYWREGTVPDCSCHFRLRKYCNYPYPSKGTCCAPELLDNAPPAQ
jgi:hypothetical protein